MIIREKEHWISMIFIWKGSVLPKLLFRLILLFLMAIAIMVFNGAIFDIKIQLNPAPFTLFGIALAIFLGFKNSTSYDRFWEARKLWGALVFTARSLTRQVQSLSYYDKNSKEVIHFADLIIVFAYVFKHQLRFTDPYQDIEKRLGTELADQLKPVIYKPVMLLKEMGNWIKTARLEGKLDSISAANIDANLNELSHILTGCERIANTPIPYTYKVLLHRTVYIYCFLLPFGFVDSLGWMMPLIITFIAYTFVALEAVADELEDPFGLEPNDLALNSMCHVIEDSLLELTDREVVVRLPPVGYIRD
ncbi:putative membrane protein [Pedobacter sp. CAN_A7]|uniref:bestrophin family protein n=1 Tax=Pedobacter sp. CAN_A7 TaxID=2787722 RepID=UPI0018CB2019